MCGRIKGMNKFRQTNKNRDGLTSHCRKCIDILKDEKARILKNVFHKDYDETLRELKEYDKHDMIKETKLNKYISYRYSIIKNRTEDRKENFTIDVNDFFDWWKSTPDICFYCDMDMRDYNIIRLFLRGHDGADRSLMRRYYKRCLGNIVIGNIRNITVDRYDNREGYIMGNMVKCCWFCNVIKGQFIHGNEYKLIAKSIIQRLRDEIYREIEHDKEFLNEYGNIRRSIK